jgi:signal transduction histidine kinase
VTRRKQNEEAILKSKEQLELKTAEVQKYATSMEKIAQERANKLREAERLAAIGATAGMVGHDIRNPLQAMVSDVYIMREEIASKCICDHKNELIESLVGIDENISYINKIVQDLQDYARPITPEYSTVDLSNVLVKVFEAVRVPESVKLSIKVKDLDRLRIDRMLMQRALSNLITNAIQAMPMEGTLEITGHLEEKKVTIIVADTGVGIPDEVKPKLFTPMMTTKSKGQGFGLAVSKRLIEVMNGTITFESVKGKGTKFIIELPTNL